jgi:hypothetical protein
MIYLLNAIIGPWKVIKIIDNTRDTYIVEVTLYDTLNDTKDTKNIEWIMKLSNSKYTNCESDIILKYNLTEYTDGLIFPLNSIHFSGIYKGYNWYVMEKCDSDCNKNIPDIRPNIESFKDDVCNFLRFIHIKKNIIHGDLKLKNVLLKDNRFKVCDYESIGRINSRYLCSVNDYIGYYYYYLGCKENKPYFSYRMDLEALGIMLWSIINLYNVCDINKSPIEMMDWQSKSVFYYNKKLNYNYYHELEILKKKEEMPNFIKNYFKIIENIDWNSILPPSNDIYDKIINLKELDELDQIEKVEKDVSNIQIKFVKTVSEKILSNKKSSKRKSKRTRTSKRLSEQIKKSSKKKKLSEKVRKNIKITVKNIFIKSYDKHLDFEMNRIDIFNNVI